ncbi:hypothetical protein ACIGMX_34520 [Streptomyces aquilus]|uniref:hypothetical protein n=1 Tax=Streptomyces aquilus TaxID=2548456 RepID=UPI0037D2DBB2
MRRCPATDTLTVGGEEVELRCVEWSDDPEARHRGDHLVHTSPLTDDHTWPNDNPLPEEETDA